MNIPRIVAYRVRWDGRWEGYENRSQADARARWMLSRGCEGVTVASVDDRYPAGLHYESAPEAGTSIYDDSALTRLPWFGDPLKGGE